MTHFVVGIHEMSLEMLGVLMKLFSNNKKRKEKPDAEKDTDTSIEIPTVPWPCPPCKNT